jgi:hypothetical protein
LCQLWKTLELPISNPQKAQSEAILRAIEELYFFRNYEKAAMVTVKALEGELQDDFREILEDYQRRCETKLPAEVAAE